MTIGYIGLGKMGTNMCLRLLSKDYKVVVYNRTYQKAKDLSKKGAIPAKTLQELTSNIKEPRLIWLMVPNTVVNQLIVQLIPNLSKGDTIIDGGNSFYKDSIKNNKLFKKHKINFLDVGVSGGPSGALNGASLMVGGEKSVYKKHESLFKDLSVENGYSYLGNPGSGHFVKMVHNAIEYGFMQSLAEGFDLLKNSEFNLNLNDVLKSYNHGSVIESKLTKDLSKAYLKYGFNLIEVGGKAQSSGEALWAVKDAETKKIKFNVIKESLKARIYSQKNPNYQAKIIQALRNTFGGHSLK